MSEVGQWLRKLGLGKYEEIFAKHEIDEDVLPELDEDDLKDLGIALGHRRKLLKAIAELRSPEAAPARSPASNGQQTGGRIWSAPREAERRQLTVMFCDLAGSTALSELLDPEDLTLVIRQYRNTCSEIVRRFDGFVARHVGDGILIYFGYPHAHEDDAERSVRAALEIVKALKGLKPLPNVSLEVRIGIATGPVVVGDLIGENTSEENAVLGRTPNLAARLQELAGPNSIVISGGTHRLVEGLFVCDDLGRKQLKGFNETVQAFRVEKVSDALSRFEASIAKGISPLVGRREEIALLMNRWELGKDEEGQVVFVSGEPGVGKSRIVKAFRDELADEWHERILSFCSPHHESTAFHPIIEHLERRLRFEEGDSSQEKLNRLKALLTRLDIPIPEHLPWLAALLAVPFENENSQPELRPEQLKRRMLETALTIIDVMAQCKPLLIVIEDLQWADPSTLQLVGELIDRMRSAKITLVGTYRPDFAMPWVGRSHVTIITLNKLSARDCRSLVGNLVEGKALPNDILNEILAKADGVPLFVEELTKNVLEADFLTDSGNGFVVSGPTEPLEIPSSLQDSLMARLDHHESSRDVAQLAAVLGRAFDYDLLAAVWKRDSEALERALAELVSAGLIFKRGSGRQAEYEFKHALLQDAAYGSLLRTTRRRYHRRVVRVLEQNFPSITKTRPEILAHHAYFGGASDKVVEYAFAAGRKSFDRSANLEAVKHLDKALEALEDLPKSDETIATAIDARLLLRYALLCVGEVTRIGQVLRETEPLIASLDDKKRTGQFEARLCNYYCLTSDQSKALEHGFRALRIAEDLDDRNLQIEMAYRLGQPYYHLAKYRDAIDVLEHGVELIDPELELDRQGKAAHPAVVGRAWLAVCHAELGDFASGTGYAQRAVQLATEAGHPLSILFARWAYGHLCIRKQSYSEALNAFEEALDVCERSALRFWYPRVASSVALARARSGAPGDTIALLEDALRSAHSMGLTVDDPRLLERLAALHQIEGELDPAEAKAREAVDLAIQADAPGYQAWALRRLGEIYATKDRSQAEQALKFIQEALGLSQALSMRPLTVLCHEGIAQICREQDRQEQAAAAEQAAREIKEGLGATPEAATPH